MFILAQILQIVPTLCGQNILRRGSHFTKIAKIQASRFHFQGEYPPPPPGINTYTWVTMWSKTSLEEGPISQKLRENAHSIFHRPWYLGPSTLPILYYFVFDVYFVTLLNERITNYIGSKFEMWLLIYTAHQHTKIAKIQASRFHFQGEYPPA